MLKYGGLGYKITIVISLWLGATIAGFTSSLAEGLVVMLSGGGVAILAVEGVVLSDYD